MYNREELVKALLVIKSVCGTYSCDMCPFRSCNVSEDITCEISSSEPWAWDIDGVTDTPEPRMFI